ncbi:MAG: aspartyl-phosphate phosphatase Spo0E family protein [Anaerobacillus sp.]|uniref:aspartyl-phosphate phosphatase Spo0E family protein n=1 Tax=Anaerobacillus sp. TaxID=1872506 RepID=UPI0039187E36
MNRDGQQEMYLQQIEELREKMISTALEYGMNHPKVLWYSQKIDEKHNYILKEKV